MCENQFFIHLFSNASDNYFPENTAHTFTSVLPETLTLPGRWYCGLVEIEYSKKSSNQEPPLHLAVHTDICQTSITGNQKSSLLRYIPMPRTKGARRVFHTPATVNYLLVNKNVIDRISVSIKPYNTTPESLVGSSCSRVALHFVKAPPVLL